MQRSFNRGIVGLKKKAVNEDSFEPIVVENGDDLHEIMSYFESFTEEGRRGRRISNK